MTDPVRLKGAERVRYFQGHYRHICATHHIPLPYFASLDVDGEAGPKTRRAIIELKKAFGVKGPWSSSLTDEFMAMVRSPFKGRYFASPARKARGLAYRAAVRRGHAKRLKAAAAGTVGQKAVRWGKRYVGKVETGYNDAPWLRDMEAELLRAGHDLGWMIPGQPYCGFGCIGIFHGGGHVELPDGTVYTPNILGYGGKTINGLSYTQVALAAVREGDLVVMNFGSGGAKHVATARGPAKGGVIPTREFNTSPGSGGSQANGGGVWDRTRSFGLCLGAVRVTKAKA